MKKSHKYALGVVLIVTGVLAFFMFSSRGDASPGRYDDFAQCVTESGAVMYGAYWCPHCQNQKEMFGNSWKYIDAVECDARGNGADPARCQAAGITGYPSWIFGDGQKLSGTLQLNSIATLTGCELPR